MIIFSIGWTKEYFHQAGFSQTNLSFWPSVKVVYRFYIQTCFEMYVFKNIATLHWVFLYNEAIDILTLLKLFTIDLDFLEVKSTKNVWTMSAWHRTVYENSNFYWHHMLRHANFARYFDKRITEGVRERNNKCF